MKAIYKFFLLALAVYSSVYPQITEITRLHVQNPSQSIKESVPAWLSENEIMIFFVNETMDTIYSTRSNDKGLTWGEQKFEFEVDTLGLLQEQVYPTALKTNNGRLLFGWSVIGEGIHLVYSDDKGIDWSQEQIIIGTGSIPGYQSHLHNIKLSQIKDDRLILCFNPANDQGTLYYKYSDNDSINWSDTAKTISRNGYLFSDHSIISIGIDSLMCVFKLQHTYTSNSSIYTSFSYNNGKPGETQSI